MNDAVPPVEPTPEGEPEPKPESASESESFSPLKEPTGGTQFIESAGRGCLGTVSFILAILIFGTISAANQIAGLIASILAIAGMVALRKRSGPSTILGAVAIGAAIALVLTGGCAIVIMNF